VTSPDYYLLDELLTDEAKAARDKVRAFVDSDLLPVINDYWDRAQFPFELVPKLAGLGVAGYIIEGHGCPGMSPLALGMATLEFARGDGSITTFMSVHGSLCMGTINLLGSEEQKQRWLPPMAALDKIGAFALTEPLHGSDSVGLETTVRRDGDSWVLNGAKRWIGNGSIGDVIVVWARDTGDGRVKAIVVEKNPDGTYPDGYTAELITGKLGKRAVWQPDITLTDVRVPLDNKLAGSQSFRDATQVLARTRGSAAWESLGHAIAAYDIALNYAKTRVQFGKPIASYQLVQAKLAEMVTEITGMQLFCFRMAQLQEQGRWTGQMASVAKFNHARKGRQICLDARDLLGGNGLLLENHIARHLTDMEVVYTYEGTDHIQALLIGRDVTGISAIQ
jgi:glutaryl-CoA dehydrogenase